MLLTDLLCRHILSQSQASGLANHGGDIRSCVLICQTDQLVDVDVLCQRCFLQVHLEDLLARLAVRHRNQDQLIKASRPQQRRIDDIRPVGGPNYHHSLQLLQAVHLA